MNEKYLIYYIKNSRKESKKLNINEDVFLLNILNSSNINQQELEYLIDNKIYKINDKGIKYIIKDHQVVIFAYKEINILLISLIFFLIGYSGSLIIQYILEIEHIIIAVSLFMPFAFLSLVYFYCYKWYKEREILLNKIIQYKKDNNQKVMNYPDY